MKNIQIKKINPNKRSIQSLIQDSAIDNSFNLEAHELRKAFNQTLATMNQKNMERERQLERIKIVLNTFQQAKIQSEEQIRTLEKILQQKDAYCSQILDQLKSIKKKYQHISYKYQAINQNRQTIELFHYQNQQNSEKNDSEKIKALKNQIYEQINKVVVSKIQAFTLQIKQYSMTRQLQSKIQSFLQQLIYLNPYSQSLISKKIKEQTRQVYQGKVKTRQRTHEGSNAEDQWQLYNKSLQKLRKLNQEKSEKSLSKRKYNIFTNNREKSPVNSRSRLYI